MAPTAGGAMIPNLLTRFVADESAATALEYCFIASLIAMAIVAVLTTLGTRLTVPFTAASNGLQ
jgi:pilus assembly protein Flp/PilA